MAKYRKKPVVIDAYKTDKELDIQTLEGTMHANIGDWIITGVNGEKYPCKPDIFEKTYESMLKPITKTQHGSKSDLKRWCPKCMERLYRKTERCPNCEQLIEW